MSNWRLSIRGSQVSSVVRSFVLRRRVDGVSSLSAVLAHPVNAGSELVPAMEDAVCALDPSGRTEFRGTISSVSADGRSVRIEAEDLLAVVRRKPAVGTYSAADQAAITSDIADGLMTVDSDLMAEDLLTMGAFSSKGIGGLETLLRLHQARPAGRSQHVLYHEPEGDALRLETIGASISGRTLALGAGLHALPSWIDTGGDIVNQVTVCSGSSSATADDVPSQEAYGIRGLSVNAPDFGSGDIATLAASLVAQRKTPRLRLQVSCRWKDISVAGASPLNQTYAIADPSRSFPSDTVRRSDDRTFTNTSGTHAWNNIPIPSVVRAGWRIKVDFKSTGQAASIWVVLHNTSPASPVTILPAASDTSGSWVTFTADLGFAIRAGAVAWAWTDGACQVRDLRLCYDDGQATVPMVSYELAWPGSKVRAVFDQASIVSLDESAELEQRVNILENHQATGGGEQPNMPSDEVIHHLFETPPSMDWQNTNQWREHRSWVVILD